MIWFTMSDDEISGPFSEQHVKETCRENTLIWGSDMLEWKNKAGWIDHLENPIVTKEEVTQEPAEEPVMTPGSNPEQEHTFEATTEPEPEVVEPITSTRELLEEVVAAIEPEVEEPIPITREPVQEEVVAAAEPEADESSIKWYYASNNEKFGPFNEAELVQMLRMLNFSEPVYLWHKGVSEWASLNTFPEIHSQVETSEAA